MAEKEIEKVLERHKKEITRHFDVVIEKVEDKIKVVSEQVAINTEKITGVEDKIKVVSEQVAINTEKIIGIEEKLKEHDGEFLKIKETLEIIKLDIEFIKNELKQKVGRDEFAALEKRVSLLEAKLNLKK